MSLGSFASPVAILVHSAGKEPRGHAIAQEENFSIDLLELFSFLIFTRIPKTKKGKINHYR